MDRTLGQMVGDLSNNKSCMFQHSELMMGAMKKLLDYKYIKYPIKVEAHGNIITLIPDGEFIKRQKTWTQRKVKYKKHGI